MAYIVKSEKCFSCHRRADSWEDDDGEVTIICALELDTESKEDGECPNYLFEAGREAILSSEVEPVSDNVMIEEVKQYVFAGNSLVEIVGANSDTEMALRPSFVEKYNAAIAMLKTAHAEQMAVYEKLHGEDLIEAQRMLTALYEEGNQDLLDSGSAESTLALLCTGVGPGSDEEDDDDEDFIEDEIDDEGFDD